MLDFLKSIAIAGAWGYIGRKFLDAALGLGLETHVFDPGLMPKDVNPARFTRIENEREFYRCKADLFHLAVHPEHRQTGMDVLLERSASEPIAVLVEKPMAAPEHPEDCARIIEAVHRSCAVVLYDFPELFDPMTQFILKFLSSFKSVKIMAIYVQRSKDREDPANPRNCKRMVHIQYQESVHCLAFALYILAHVKGSPAAALANGITVKAKADPYSAPNPQDYPYVVDGRCRYVLKLGDIEIRGLTDFKKGAEFTKRRIITALAEGNTYIIEADYQEGVKRLTINGEPVDFSPDANSYESVIRTMGEWVRSVSRDDLMRGLYPHPQFARLTYQLSSALWRSCWERKKITFASLDDLLDFEASFAADVPTMPRYE